MATPTILLHPNPSHADVKVVLIGNLVKYDDDYRILLLVGGQWTDIGIACATYMEAMDVADRTLDQLFVNLPVSESSHLPISEAA